jgi:hypothetical protein
MELRRRRLIGALSLIGFGAFMLIQQTVGFGQFVVLGIGLALLAAYLMRPRPSNLIVPAGFFTGLGTGIVLVTDGVTPHIVHGAIMLAALALGFGLIFTFGDARHGWARVPATFFAALSVVVLTFAGPWHVAFGTWWPLLLVVLGLWLMRPRNRRRIDWV